MPIFIASSSLSPRYDGEEVSIIAHRRENKDNDYMGRNLIEHQKSNWPFVIGSLDSFGMFSNDLMEM